MAVTYPEISWERPSKIAKVLSLAENQDEQLIDLMEHIYPKTGRAHIVGITGSPGAGKSSLVNALIKKLRERDIKVGVIAVDPSSPFSGGAILGDRVRMQDHSLDSGVFIRSMASRGSLGGVSVATREAIAILDASGFDVILLETVGVGQSEIDVVKIADSVMVVLTPNAGDSIQTMKAGIMEIGSMFVINKADLPGANKIYREIEAMLDFHYHDARYRPEIISTSAISGQGLTELAESLETHKAYLQEEGRWEALREKRAREHVIDLIRHELGKRIEQRVQESETNHILLKKVLEHKLSPHKAASELVKEFIGF